MNISWRFGVSGDFATASNWNPAVVPGPTDNAFIDVNGIYTVTSSAHESVDSLNILDSVATLFITGDSSLVTGDGVNDGTIIADSGSTFGTSTFFPQGGSFENSGTLEATNTDNLSTGGLLEFLNVTITNSPQGVIEANGANTNVRFEGHTTMVGGTLETHGANAVINLHGDGSISGAAILDGTQPDNPVNIEGNVAITGEGVAKLLGTINNSGVITMEGGVFPSLVCQANVTLEGGGDITMTNPVPDFFLAPSIFGGVLTNVDNTISGTGVLGQISTGVGLGSFVGTFINDTKGTIDADASAPLLIAGVGPDSNAGLMEATQGGTLLIDNVTIDNFVNHAKGTVEAGEHSTVGLENATITGGFVRALPGSTIEAEQGSNTISGAHLTNAGTIGAEGANLTIAGDVNNHNGNLDADNGTLVINGAVKHGTATLEGSSEIEFGGASSADVTFAANSMATLKLDAPHAFKGTVSGFTTGDHIDLPNINFADNPTLSYSSKTGVLTVTDNVSGVTDTITFKGAVGPFSAQSNGSGGTLISDPPAASVVAMSPDQQNHLFAPDSGAADHRSPSMVVVSHDGDSFLFAANHGGHLENLLSAHDQGLVQTNSQLADLIGSPDQAHQDRTGLIAHDALDIHAAAAQHAHDLLL